MDDEETRASGSSQECGETAGSLHSPRDGVMNGLRALLGGGKGVCLLCGVFVGFFAAAVALSDFRLALGMTLAAAVCAAALAAAVFMSVHADARKRFTDEAPSRIPEGVPCTRQPAEAVRCSAARHGASPEDVLAIEYQLTPRERDVLGLLIKGRDVRHIGDALYVSVNTVRTHVQNVYAKLGVHSRQELIDFVETCSDERDGNRV